MKTVTIGILALVLVQGCTSNVKNKVETVKKYPAFDVQNMDTKIKPGDDFYSYTNGTWLKNNPIPADKNSRSTFDELIEKNRHDIRGIIEEAAALKDVKPGSNNEKIGSFYTQNMNILIQQKISK